MTLRISQEEATARRVSVLQAARWCFLNFGFSKTSLDDIAQRARISRTLLYRTFKDKQDIFTAVFTHWLVARHPAAKQAAVASGSKYQRLFNVCRLMMLEPWSEMAGAPMASEFFDVCERLDPEVAAHHRNVTLQCVTEILGDEMLSEVFLLALDGLLADEPAPALLEERVQMLVARFAPPTQRGK